MGGRVVCGLQPLLLYWQPPFYEIHDLPLYFLCHCNVLNETFSKLVEKYVYVCSFGVCIVMLRLHVLPYELSMHDITCQGSSQCFKEGWTTPLPNGNFYLM